MRYCLQHMHREQKTENAAPEIENLQIAGSKNTSEGMKDYRDKLPEKVRKNAVHGIEFMITASPEVSKKWQRIDWEDYFTRSKKWISNNFGGDENIISAKVHFDETTPHLSVLTMPIKEGKLNAKHYIGGSKYRLTELQDDFHQNVGNQLGLDRGIKNSKAKHIDIQTYYTRVNNAMESKCPAVTVEDKSIRELLHSPKETFTRGVRSAVHELLPYIKTLEAANEDRKLYKNQKEHLEKVNSKNFEKHNKMKEQFENTLKFVQKAPIEKIIEYQEKIKNMRLKEQREREINRDRDRGLSW